MEETMRNLCLLISFELCYSTYQLMEKSKSRSDPLPGTVRTFFGASAGIFASSLLQPLEVVKVRMQMSGVGTTGPIYKNSVHCAKEIVVKEGWSALYTGFTPGLVRQTLTTATKVGVYKGLLFITHPQQNSKEGPVSRFLCGIVAGASAAFVSCPAEVVMVRMAAEGRLVNCYRHKHHNVGEAVSFVKKESNTAFLKGAVPAMVSTTASTACTLAIYGPMRQRLIDTGMNGDAAACHFLCSMGSGLIAAGISVPMEVVKTRLQSMSKKQRVKGGIPVTPLGMMWYVLSTEGPHALWRGFLPYYTRLVPQVILASVFMDRFIAFYRK